jgi:toxin ParE1/3/4
MPTELIWSNRARTDLLEIYVMIGLEQPAAAERYFDRIEAKAELLRSQPRMGVRRPDIRPSLRMLVEAPYLLLYRADPDADEGPVGALEIIRIIDGRRDLHGIFQAGSLSVRIVNVGRLGGTHADFNFDLHAARRVHYIGVTFRTRSIDEIRDIFD